MNNVFKLDAIGERAAGGDYGILELNAREMDAEVGTASAGAGRDAHREFPMAWLRSCCGTARPSAKTRPMA